MEKGSFIFYASFDEALKELPDKSRLKIYDAICDYALRGIEQDLSGVEKAVLSLIKPQLKANNQRYENGCKGGRPKKNQNETDGYDEEETKEKPKQNQNKTTPKPNENENENVNVITPPFIPPQGKKTKKRNVFFEEYPKYASYNGSTEGIDFDGLLEEFSKSSYLRSLYTFKQVLAIYDGILKGEYRDKTTAADEINARAERETFYAARRRDAEKESDRVMAKAMKDKEFAENEKAINAIQLRLAKATLYDKESLPALEIAHENMLRRRRELLASMGFTEEDLKPKYHCDKCNDTGFTADGRSCDCYGR